MTRREWIAACLQSEGCPDDQIDYHLGRLRIDDSPWRTPDDDASGGMMRHDERRGIRTMVEGYAEEVHTAEEVWAGRVRVGVAIIGGWEGDAVSFRAATP
jgi:hypothetical protein